MADDSIWTRIGKSIGFAGDVDYFEAPEPEFAPEQEAVSGAPRPEENDDIAKAMAVPTNTLGTSNVTDVGGYIFEKERVPDLMGANRYKTFDRMVRDTTIIAAGVRLFLNLLANADWNVVPAEDQADNPRAKEIADLAYDMLFDMTTSWSSVVRKTAMYRFQGFSVQEWTAKRRDDGAIGLLDIENRPQESIVRWLRDPSGTVETIVQRTQTQPEVLLPRGKVVYAVDDTLSESPEGMGLFRHLAPTYDRLRQFLELELIGYETDLRGIPIARAPLGELKRDVDLAAVEGATALGKAQATRTRLLKPMMDFVKNHIRNKKSGVLIPSDTYQSQSNDATTSTNTPKWALELLTGDSTSFADAAKAIVRMNEELARLLGVEHLMLGTGGSGSLALAQSKVGTFYLTITSTLMDMVEIFERDILEPLAMLNGWPPELIPTIAVSEISEMDIEMVTRSLASLATAGAPLIITDPAVKEVYARLGLTPPDPEEHQAVMDAALAANKPKPGDPPNPDNQSVGAPEDQVAKRRQIKSSRGIARTMRAMKKAA